MLLKTAWVLAALAVAGADAQAAATTYTTSPPASATTTPAPSTTWTSSSGPKTTTISVGAFGFNYTPNNVTAAPGDTVEFVFFPDGHSVIRAEFGFPCYPYEMVDHGKEGFYSGQQPVKAIALDKLPRFRLRINDTMPVFFYCGAPTSCSQHAMIGAINPNSTYSLEAQLEYQKNVQFQLLPGDPWPSESGVPMPTGPATANATSAPAPASGGDDHAHLSPGAIAGIAIGGAAVLLLGAALVYLCGRRGGFDKAYRKSTASWAGPPPVAEAQYRPTAKSPGAETWASTQYNGAAAVPHDVYRDQPSQLSHYGPTSPPINPHHSGSYGTYAPTMGSPLMSDYGNHPGTPPPHAMAPPPPAPVELPTSGDPGNSPLPNYQPAARQYSWSGGQESGYRPTKQ